MEVIQKKVTNIKFWQDLSYMYVCLQYLSAGWMHMADNQPSAITKWINNYYAEV